MALPTPCADWDLGMLLAHLSDSMADLETAIRTGNLDLERPPERAAGDPVEILRDRAAELLCAAYSYSGPEHFVAVGGLPVPAGLVACTGAVEIAVHGWDVSAARGRASCGRPAPSRPGSPPGCSGWARCSWPAATACSPTRSMSRPRPARETGSSATSAAARVTRHWLLASNKAEQRSLCAGRPNVPRTARDVVFVNGVRTPFGKAGPTGLYAETRADDMVVSVIRELLRRNPAAA